MPESFSARLQAEVAPMWQQIFEQPFLREIKDGTLPLEKFQYYLGQDYLYLEGFARTVALTLAKAPTSRAAGGTGPAGDDAGGTAVAPQAGGRGRPDDGGRAAGEAVADEHGLCQPHADDRSAARVGSGGGSAAALPLDVP